MKNRINPANGMEFGLYSLGDHIPNPLTGSRLSAGERIQEIIELARLAEDVGIDVFGVGESHQSYFTTQAHTVVLGAIAQATNTIKLTSSASVISVADPVRVYEEFATLDLISNGRAEIVAGRGSRVGAYDLFGVDLKDYEAIFEEKLALLKQINDAQGLVNWESQFRKPLVNADILPKPSEGTLPLWRAVGGPPGSAIKAGYMGVPMMLTTLGGPAQNFAVSVDAYYEALERSGFKREDFPLATASLFHVGDTAELAANGAHPHLSGGFQAIRGSGYPFAQVANAAQDPTDALMVGDSQMIIEKILYQYELFGMHRFMAQIDFGGVPFDKLMHNIEIIGRDILPAIKKYTQA